MLNNDDQFYDFFPTKISIESVLKLVEEPAKHIPKKVELQGHNVNRVSLRLRTFKEKGCVCVSCGNEATHFRLQRNPRNGTQFHLGLWTDDGHQMSKDHIVPKSKGGKDNLKNMQTMCRKCNELKGNTYNEYSRN